MKAKKASKTQITPIVSARVFYDTGSINISNVEQGTVFVRIEEEGVSLDDSVLIVLDHYQVELLIASLQWALGEKK